MGAKSKARIVIAKIYSQAATGYSYTLRRPRTSEKFELMRYDPIGIGILSKTLTDQIVKKHVLFTETKAAIPKP